MPAAKSQVVESNGSTAKGNTSGTATPVSTVDKKDTSDHLASLAAGKPDKKLYDAEQDRIKLEIDALQVKLSAVRDKISLATKSNSSNDRRSTLRAELDSIRNQQSSNKASRSKVLEQIKGLQDSIQKKIKDLQAAKSKIPFKTAAEVDAHIQNLEKQVESGNMKLADEKRALQEISSVRRNRRVVEGFQADQESIESDRHTVDELKKQLDDPESKAVSERFDSIKTELDELKKEGDEAYAGRTKLFEERDSLQAQLNTLFNQKRESSQQFRDLNDRYWTKVNEDRARRVERAREQRAAEDAQKKREIAERLREDAEIPAFQAQIEDCQTLIDHFSGKSSVNAAAPLTPKLDVVGVPKLEIRKVDGAPEGSVARKKKGEEEESYFVGGKGKGKGKRSAPKSSDANGASPASPTSSSPLNVPLATLSALLTLSIPPPASAVDVPRVIEDLKTKKAWFEANQARVTAENITKAENEIQRLTNTTKEVRTEGAVANDALQNVEAESTSTTPQDSGVGDSMEEQVAGAAESS